jgi:hypothetical protein
MTVEKIGTALNDMGEGLVLSKAIGFRSCVCDCRALIFLLARYLQSFDDDSSA